MQYKKNTIVFIHKYPLSRVFADVINFDCYAKAGFDLVFLDLKQIYFKDTHHKYGTGQSGYVYKKDFFVECSSKREVKQWIARYSDKAWFFILHHSFIHDLDDIWIFRSLKKNNSEYILMEILNLPDGGVNEPKSIKKHLFKKVMKTILECNARLLIRASLRWFFLFLSGRDILFRKPALCFASGAVASDKFKAIYPSSEIVAIPNKNFQSYKQFLESNNNSNGVSGHDAGYFLYLDQAIFDAPDRKLLNRGLIPKEVFFEQINHFFSRLERVYNCRTVIAASPKYNYKGNEYEGREIIENKTLELVVNCSAVIMHATSALDYAVIMNKPIVFLYFEGMGEEIFAQMRAYANAVGKKILVYKGDADMDEVARCLEVDAPAYKEYLNNYISTENFNDSSANIICNTLRERGFAPLAGCCC